MFLICHEKLITIEIFTRKITDVQKKHKWKIVDHFLKLNSGRLPLGLG